MTSRDPVAELHRAVEAGDWEAVRLALHPYVRWTTADGRTLRGRRKVLASLEAVPPSTSPASVELRDGQIYRWTERAA